MSTQNDIDTQVLKSVAQKAKSLSEAASLLGISRTTLRRKMSKLGLSKELGSLSEKGTRLSVGSRLDKDEVLLVIEEASSLSEAARLLQIDRKALKKFMDRNGLKSKANALIKRGIKTRKPVDLSQSSFKPPKRIPLKSKEEERALEEEVLSASKEKQIIPPSKEDLANSFWEDLDLRLAKLDSRPNPHEMIRPTSPSEKPLIVHKKQELKELLIRLTKIMVELYEEE